MNAKKQSYRAVDGTIAAVSVSGIVEGTMQNADMKSHLRAHRLTWSVVMKYILVIGVNVTVIGSERNSRIVRGRAYPILVFQHHRKDD